MSSKYKNQNFLYGTKTKEVSNLTALTTVLHSSSQQLRHKWCERLLYKLYITHNKFKNAKCNVCLDNLKIDEHNNLVLVNVSDNGKLSEENNTRKQTDARFVAPELMKCNETSKAGDVWAAGICIFYIINSKFPWKTAARSDERFFEWASRGVFPGSADDSYMRAVRKMLYVDSDMRPNIKNVISIMLDTGTDKSVKGKLISMIATDYIKQSAYEQEKKEKLLQHINAFQPNDFISSKQVLVECTDPANNLKRRIAEHKPDNFGWNSFVLTEDDKSFIDGLIVLNHLLVCKIEQRSPDHPIGRFSEYCDVQTAFPHLTKPQIERALKEKAGFHRTDLLNHEDLHVTAFKRIFNAAIERTYLLPTASLNEQDFDLTLCSPWPSKEEPESVTESKNDPRKGQIYTNIQATHRVADDFVVDQETEEGEKFGYVTSPVLFRATVAFPEIREGEIWTIGWIQGIKKGLAGCYFERDERSFSTIINLYKQKKYSNDGDNVRFPWYDDNSFVTIEGPTDNHSIVQVLLVDMPSGVISTKDLYSGEKLEKTDRDFEADLMLTAIEENTGHMIVLAVVEWGKFVCFQYDHTKPLHSRTKLTGCSSYCNNKKGRTSNPQPLISNVPAYFISNLSEAKRRPNSKNPLYSALHGPTANKSSMEYEHLNFCDNLLKIPVLPNEMLSKWKNEQRLYLYHGKRDCVKREENKKRYDVFNYFDIDADAALYKYPKHELACKLNENIENVKNLLKSNLEAVDAPDWQVKTLLARNITRDLSTEAPFNWKSFLTDAGTQAESSESEQPISASNKRPRVKEQ